jgi:hypothetical protein
MNTAVCADIQSDCILYVVLDTPKAPQAQPWKGVLDKACSWAWGESSVIPAVGEVVEGVYTSGYEYHDEGGEVRYIDPADEKFTLDTCLGEWGDGDKDINCWDTAQMVLGEWGDGDKDINCWDTAQMVCIFSNALGCDLETYYMARSGNPPPVFLLNYIKPIGRSWTNDPFIFPGRQGFQCHWTASTKVTHKIHDACLQVDNDRQRSDRKSAHGEAAGEYDI